MITSKEIGEKILMFNNLLYHLDDYIRNKKERKGQLQIPKSLRLVLREIISSKKNIKYFLSKEEIDLRLGVLLPIKKAKKSDEPFKIMKTITPFSFNQKNLDTLNFFYDSRNEVYVLNYLILEKIFTVIRFCFIEAIKKAKKEMMKNLENKNKNNFLFRKIENYETYSLNDNSINNIFTSRSNRNCLKKEPKIKKEDEFDTSSTNRGIKKISSNNIFKTKRMKEISKKSHFNISSLFNNNYNFKNIICSQDIQNNNYNNNNLLGNLRWQVKKVDNRVWLSKIKIKKDRHSMKKQCSFPLISDYKYIFNKSLEKKRKKENEESSLLNENKTDERNVLLNIMKSKKINSLRTTLFNSIHNMHNIQNKSGIENNYDYKELFPYFKITKIKIKKNNS